MTTLQQSERSLEHSRVLYDRSRDAIAGGGHPEHPHRLWLTQIELP